MKLLHLLPALLITGAVATTTTGPDTSTTPGACCAAGALQDKESPTGPTLAAIVALAGDWYAVDEDGAVTDQLVSRYRVTAGGNAVLETVFPGQDEEMITMYHQDGKDLVLTHYCVVGNQTSYRASFDADGKTLVYTCTGVTNTDTHDAAHMHEGRIAPAAGGRLQSTWNMIEKGESIFLADYTLARKE